LPLDRAPPEGHAHASKTEDHHEVWSNEQLSRLGLREGPNALKPGDEIVVTIVPALDGKSPVGLLSAITYKDGHTVRFRSPDE
jgi:hypothetical protein